MTYDFLLLYFNFFHVRDLLSQKTAACGDIELSLKLVIFSSGQVTFIVTHFNDPRISSAELRDLLLQSISVLVQDKEFLAAFECNEAATKRMPRALLSAFDNRSWIPVTNILLRLCKGSGFGFSRRGESSSSSVHFQVIFYLCCYQSQRSSFLIHIAISSNFFLWNSNCKEIAAGSLHQ